MTHQVGTADAGTDSVAWAQALDEDDLWEGELTSLTLEGDSVLLVRLPDDNIRAYQGMCPHQEIELVDGEYDQDDFVLICPGHSWEFDLRDGAGVNPSNCRLFSFPTKVEDGVIYVGIPQDGQRHYNRGASD